MRVKFIEGIFEATPWRLKKATSWLRPYLFSSIWCSCKHHKGTTLDRPLLYPRSSSRLHAATARLWLLRADARPMLKFVRTLRSILMFHLEEQHWLQQVKFHGSNSFSFAYQRWVYGAVSAVRQLSNNNWHSVYRVDEANNGFFKVASAAGRGLMTANIRTICLIPFRYFSIWWSIFRTVKD